MVKEIAFTAYPSKDVPKLRAFYESALGLKFSDPWEQDGIVKYAEADMGPRGCFALATDEWYDVSPSSGVAFEVDDIERALDAVKSHGGQAKGEIHDTGSCRMVSFKDPSGNAVTLHQAKG